MKKILVLFSVFFIFSCSFLGYEIKKIDKDENNIEKENNIVSLSIKNDLENLINVYENELNIDNNQYIEELLEFHPFFIDGIKTCNEITKFDLFSNDGKNEFLEYLNLKELYNFVLEQNIEYFKYFDEKGNILKKYNDMNFDDKDLLIVMFFSGKIDKNFFIKEINNLSKKYYELELTNSIMLDIIGNYINSGEKITYDICKEKFLNGYINYQKYE